jgi:hypothetical protein
MTAEMSFNTALVKMVAATTRQRVIMEVEAFAGEYHHHLDGRDVIIVEQLLDFLKSGGSDGGS